MSGSDSVVLHVFVVGFHHKKGCTLEYCYPPLSQSDPASLELPPEWAALPSLAMPDGVHNVDHDSSMFILPPAEQFGQRDCVYCLASYRQINADALINRSDDVTRSTVQKSVCVVCRAPIFAGLRAKLDLITKVYFNERDFSKKEVLAEMYDSLNGSFAMETLETQILLGISTRNLIRTFRHRILIMFKLFLLEKRVLFSMFPVQTLCQTMLAVLSLFPNQLENGLTRSAVHLMPEQLNAEPKYPEIYAKAHPKPKEAAKEINEGSDVPIDEGEQAEEQESDSSPTMSEQTAVDSTKVGPLPVSQSSESLKRWLNSATNSSVYTKVGSKLNQFWGQPQQKMPNSKSSSTDQLSPATVDAAIEAKDDSSPAQDPIPTDLSTDSWGFPLSIFTEDSLFLPYASLSTLDLIKSGHVRSYVVGATNALFKHRKELFDAVIQLDEKTGEPVIELFDNDLKRQLAPTTADLRFADFVMKNVGVADTGDVFVDDTNWEGGDEWVRLQFRAYLLSLYATIRSERLGTASSTADVDSSDFNDSFVNGWKLTRNYAVWASNVYPDLSNAVPGHPFAGQLSVSDMKLRVQMMTGGENARRLQDKLGQTGRYVAEKSNQFKTTLAGWFKGQDDETNVDDS